MKIALIYLTGTGSTAKFADEIAKGLRSKQHDVSFFRIEKTNLDEIEGFDIIGIGTPTFSYRAPRLVTKILKKYPKKHQPYFLFDTCGGGEGNTAWSMYKVLKKKGWVFLDSINGYGPTNIRSWMPKLDREPLKKCLSERSLISAYNFGMEIEDFYQKIILEKIQKPKKIHLSILHSIWSILLSYRWQMAATTGKKHVDPEKCNQCGLCATHICTSGCISLDEKNMPKFEEKICIGCSGCTNLCPKDAIWSKSAKNHHQYSMYRKYVLNPPK